MLEKALGNLLCFIAEVAESARFNTAYNKEMFDNPESPVATMHFTSMLNNLDRLGVEISHGNHEAAMNEVDMLKGIWESNKASIAFAKSVNNNMMPWSVDDGIGLLDDIKKALEKRIEAHV